jgi:hypothetical protein
MRTLSLLTLLLLTVSGCSSDSKKNENPTGGAGGEGPYANAGAGGNNDGSSGAAAQGGANSGGGTGGATFTDALVLPEVYPRLRAATPETLVAGSAAASSSLSQLGTLRQPLEAGPELAGAIQDRFYSSGPTDLLRIVKNLDDRVQGLNLDPEAHTCLSSAPVSKIYALPDGQTFEVKLQCLQSFGGSGAPSGWVGFGFAEAASNSATPVADAGLDAGGTVAADDAGPSSGGRDFYLIEGQSGGNGGAYRIDAQGNVEAWIAVAERDIPSNSQVLMHLKTVESASTLELVLAGSGVGFCSAHLKTNPDLVYTQGKTNAPPPPGEEPVVGVQYCNALSGGCFEASALDVDLGAESETCAPVAASSFAITHELDADTSGDAGTNVDPGTIYEYFGEAPAGVPAF